MRKPGTNPDHVQMEDVLCDFCRREWVEERPMIEGHQGSCICGECLTAAYEAIINRGASDLGVDYSCTMCLESQDDRSALDRADEPGWSHPEQPEASVCRRCVKLAAGALHKSSDFDWSKPTA